MEIALLLGILGMAWFWLDSIRNREIAIVAGQEAAAKYGLQFLDETVALTKLRLARDGSGRLRPLRTYGFEVSDTGVERLSCSITLLGRRVETMDIPPHFDNVIRLY